MYRQSEINLLNSNISSRCPCNMVNFGPLTAEIGWRVWGTPANFNVFRVFTSLLQQHHSPEAFQIQTLHGLAISLAHTPYIHLRGLLHADRIFPGAKFTLHLSLTSSNVGSVTAWHTSSERQPKFAACYKEWNYRTFAETATYIRLGSHHTGYRPTF